jgi:zinc protease
MYRTIISLLLTLMMSAIVRAENNTFEHTLDNGLKIIVREDHRSPVFVTQVWYRVGSSYEPQGITGISHVVEHMMFKGSKKLMPGEFSRTIASYGGVENAFTTDDYTAYYEVLSAHRLPLSLELEADRMRNLLLDEAEFKKEIKVVMEERRLRVDDNPHAQLGERFIAVAQMNSYAQPVIGWMHDLEQMNIEDVRTWYNSWYAPNNATLVVVGDVKADEVFDLADTFFGDIPRTTMPAAKTITNMDNPGERRLTVTLNADVPSLLMGFNVPVVRTAKVAWEPYALAMLAGVLDGGNSARFATRLIRGQEIATGAGAGYDAFSRGDSIFTISGTPNIERHVSVQKLEAALWHEIENIKKTPPSEKELARIKAQVISDLVYTRDSIADQASMIGSLESVGLTWRLMDQQLELLSAITPAQIQQVAKKYLVRERLTTAILNPNAKSKNSIKGAAPDLTGAIR